MEGQEILKDQIQGFKAKIKELRSVEKLFLKMVGIDEQILKGQDQIDDLKKSIKKTKIDLAEYKSDKRKALIPTAKDLSETMSAILPTGKAIFNIDDEGAVHIGWHIKGERISPYDGLSGSEKAQFDNALAFALLGDEQSKVIIVEASEMDRKHQSAFLKHVSESNPEAQIIINHWQKPSKLTEDWNPIKL